MKTKLKTEQPYIDVTGIGQRLKEIYLWLKDNGRVTSEKEFASRIGISKTTLQRWTADTPDTNVQLEALVKVCQFSVDGKCPDLWWLISGESHQTGMERLSDTSIPIKTRYVLALDLSKEFLSIAQDLVSKLD